MRVVVDYRPALRTRSGVGEYVHHIARALARRYPGDSLTLFTSSWKDRPSASVGEYSGARMTDYRVPVRVLNYAWHNLEWPSIELLTGARYDVAFSPHPLLLPAQAAQVVMIHDLDFLRTPERTHGEIRRDYPRFARSHAHRAAAIVAPSEYTAGEIVDAFGVPRERISVCPPGAPEWPAPERLRADGYVLFIGTLEARKNIPRLIAAYASLVARRPDVPKLVLAGRAQPEAAAWLDTVYRGPLAGRVEYLGYVADEDRPKIYAGARVLVLASLEEGFGMPALEAMSLGIPVVASRRGALPELVGDAGLLVEPEDEQAIGAAIEQLVGDYGLACGFGARGRARAERYQWSHTADALHAAFTRAVQAHTRGRLPGRAPLSKSDAA